MQLSVKLASASASEAPAAPVAAVAAPAAALSAGGDSDGSSSLLGPLGGVVAGAALAGAALFPKVRQTLIPLSFSHAAAARLCPAARCMRALHVPAASSGAASLALSCSYFLPGPSHRCLLFLAPLPAQASAVGEMERQVGQAKAAADDALQSVKTLQRQVEQQGAQATEAAAQLRDLKSKLDARNQVGWSWVLPHGGAGAGRAGPGGASWLAAHVPGTGGSRRQHNQAQEHALQSRASAQYIRLTLRLPVCA